ncbi:MAG: methyltransferase domain-containing protein [Candidatus Coatesbacteria bacterium]|nr:methyltransferase domain-containing protein [Candidatus Coatesbacteria bacterium]
MDIKSIYYDSEYSEEYLLHKNRYLNPDRFQEQKIKNIKSLISNSDLSILLDIGCGIGTIALTEYTDEKTVVGQDYALSGLKIGYSIAKNEKKEIFWIKGSINYMPYNDATFTTIIAADLFEHLDDKDSALLLSELKRILKREGTLAIYSPSKEHFLEKLKKMHILKLDESHIGMRSVKQIQKIAENAGFITIKSYYAVSHIPILKQFEIIFGRIPFIKGLFKRRICWLGSPK